MQFKLLAKLRPLGAACVSSGRDSSILYYALVALFVWLSAECIRGNPVVLDEYGHIPAGLSHWLLGRHYLYRENPPLVRLMTSLPVLLSSPALDYSRAFEGQRSEWMVGADFINANKDRYHHLIERARCVSLFLSIATAGLIFWWVREDRGSTVAAVCAAIWLTDPSVLAHSSIATIDVGASAFGCLAAYAFWRYLRVPVRSRAIVAGVCLGLAETAKFSLLVFYPAWLCLMVAHRWVGRSTNRDLGVRPAKPAWWDLILIFTISLFALNLLYGFDETGRRLGSFEFRSTLLSGLDNPGRGYSTTANRLRNSWLATLPVPLPAQYVLGFDSQKRDEEVGFARLENRRIVRVRHWYSPFETLAYKLPLGSLILLSSSLIVLPFTRRGILPGSGVAFVSALFLLAMLATQSGLNWPIRYALPALPLLAVACGGSIRAMLSQRLGKIVIAACVLGNVLSVLAVRPGYLAYANELAGGPSRANRLFLGSNLDWGQDLYRLKAWHDSAPEPLPVHASYYGVLSIDGLRIPTVALPASFLRGREIEPSPPGETAPRDFYWVISSNILSGMPANAVFTSGWQDVVILDRNVLRPERAFARVGQTLFVFRVSAKRESRSGSLSHEELRGCLRPATDFERTRLISP